jgi:2,4-dienoyl-CoA reductase (NADPH2)
MEQPEIDAVVAGFAESAAIAVEAGLDGVELDAGAFSLLRQFHSALTNQRSDSYGADRLRLTEEVVAAVRQALGVRPLLSLRLCCDELAPWAGVTPEQAAEHVARLAGALDLLVVVRGGPFSTTAYRPDAHTPPSFNRDLCRAMRDAAAGRVPVVLQGSVVDPAAAQAALDDGVADLVEMTRAQIADARLVDLVRRGAGDRIRPCLLCNQACRVRDTRNPIVSCVVDPRSGHETEDPPEEGRDSTAQDVLVVGGGPAGLECARVLALRGHRVRVRERAEALGGVARIAARQPGRERLAAFVEWLERECRTLGARLEPGAEASADDIRSALDAGTRVVLATGSRPAGRRFASDGEVTDSATTVVDALGLLSGGVESIPAGPVVVHDPVGGPAGVALAEWLRAAREDVVVVTPDPVVGTLLSLTGDLADANTRLQRAGVRRELRALLRAASGGRAVLEDVWTGERREIACAVLVDCGHRLADDALALAHPAVPRAGDCVAPRTLLEAVLEGRRRALEVSSTTVRQPRDRAGAA